MFLYENEKREKRHKTMTKNSSDLVIFGGGRVCLVCLGVCVCVLVRCVWIWEEGSTSRHMIPRPCTNRPPPHGSLSSSLLLSLALGG